MKKLLFIMNPKAGRGAIRNEIFDIIVLFSQAGYEVTVYPTTGPDDAQRKVREDGAGYDMLVCAGGDGTLDNTVSGYMQLNQAQIPLGYIPIGTTNDFGRSLRISRRPLEAAYQIVNGKESKIDVGKLGDRSFIYIAAFGIFTEVSYNTNQNLKKALGHSAYVLEGIRNLVGYKGYEITASFDEKVISGTYIYGMVTNTLSVGGFKLRGAKHVILDDGKFDCLFIKMPTNPEELQQILTGIVQNDIEGNEMFFESKASKVVIHSQEEISWTVDGEYGGTYKDIEIQNMKQALTILLEDIPTDEMAYQGERKVESVWEYDVDNEDTTGWD